MRTDCDESRHRNEISKRRRGERGAISLWSILLIVALVASWGVIGWLMLNKEAAAKEDPIIVEKEQVETLLETDQEERGLFPLETLIVNLDDKDTARYLKTTIKLELTNKEFVAKIQKNEITKAKLMDTILLVLSSKKYEALLGIEGRMRVRQELILRLNAIVEDKCIRNVYFTEFVVQ